MHRCHYWRRATFHACGAWCNCCERHVCICSTGSVFMCGYSTFEAAEQDRGKCNNLVLAAVCGDCWTASNAGYAYAAGFPRCKNCHVAELIDCRREREIVSVFCNDWLRYGPLPVQMGFLVLEYSFQEEMKRWMSYEPELKPWRKLLAADLHRQVLGDYPALQQRRRHRTQRRRHWRRC